MNPKLTNKVLDLLQDGSDKSIKKLCHTLSIHHFLLNGFFKVKDVYLEEERTLLSLAFQKITHLTQCKQLDKVQPIENLIDFLLKKNVSLNSEQLIKDPYKKTQVKHSILFFTAQNPELFKRCILLGANLLDSEISEFKDNTKTMYEKLIFERDLSQGQTSKKKLKI